MSLTEFFLEGCSKVSITYSGVNPVSTNPTNILSRILRGTGRALKIC